MAAQRRKKLTHVDAAGRARMVDITAKRDTACEARLAEFFLRSGYMRMPRHERRQKLGRRYRKGWEVRLVLNSEDELNEVRRLLEQAGLKPGKAFKKWSRWVQPIYGKQAVNFFSAWNQQG